MNWSLGEVRSLSLKAARGAGLEWGQAEELSHSVYWLQQRSMPGVVALANYLEWRENADVMVPDTDPVLLASSIRDTGEWERFFPAKTSQPLLLIPAIASVLEGECVEAEWPGNKVLVVQDDASCPTPAEPVENALVKIEVRKSDSSFVAGDLCHRFYDTPEKALTILQHFANKTYAPATEASRLAGAGAGNDGND